MVWAKYSLFEAMDLLFNEHTEASQQGRQNGPDVSTPRSCRLAPEDMQLFGLHESGC